MNLKLNDMKKQIITKLNKAREEISSMILNFERNESCIDVILQSKKIRNILREVDSIILNDHLNRSVNKFIETNLSDTYLKEIMKGVKML